MPINQATDTRNFNLIACKRSRAMTTTLAPQCSLAIAPEMDLADERTFRSALAFVALSQSAVLSQQRNFRSFAVECADNENSLARINLIRCEALSRAEVTRAMHSIART